MFAPTVGIQPSDFALRSACLTCVLLGSVPDGATRATRDPGPRVFIELKRSLTFATNVSPRVRLGDCVAHPLRAWYPTTLWDSVTMATDNKSVSGKSGIEPAEKDRRTSGDGEESTSEPSPGFSKQRSATSGTTSLAGDTANSNDKPGPGGVE